jgi:hypothetical protein
MNVPTISKTQYRQTVKILKNALNLNKRGITAVINDDYKLADEMTSKVKISAEKHLKDYIFHTMYQLASSEIRKDGEGSSTALCPKYNGVWTIGIFGSVFIDIRAKSENNGSIKSIRVHFDKEKKSFFLEEYVN